MPPSSTDNPSVVERQVNSAVDTATGAVSGKLNSTLKLRLTTLLISHIDLGSTVEGLTHRDIQPIADAAEGEVNSVGSAAESLTRRKLPGLTEIVKGSVTNDLAMLSGDYSGLDAAMAANKPPAPSHVGELPASG
ncbi:hypothetical protein N7495_007934 [Penicillium taxi]|uniref:uncharacterized protein n=1 Tax=Penicillium taxi TaxID=168475 RepID=UPI00254561FA|nr:uncharacterized protein N7495_007934 [Penicillium taxi]KAJ5887893.1 hypothetical protein N7495_007934 [Penicillium taxi]